MTSSCIPQNSTFSASNIRACENYVFTMQKRLDKAVANNDHTAIRNIFTILVRRSRAVKILAVYRVTYKNTGKKTAGVDGISIPQGTRESTDYIRHQLLKAIDIKKKPSSIKRTYIPKPNGKKRPLGIPTMIDRIIQAIIKIALEPIVEFHSHDNSYGFRPKRSSHDAMDMLHKCLSNRTRKRYIVEGDIKGCFDHIDHDHITQTLLKWKVPNYAVQIIKRMLKSKIMETHEPTITSTEGTPQGGIISPMLANVALTSFDDFVANRFGTISYHGGKHYTNPMIRYADDFVILCRSKTQAKYVKEEISKYLLNTIGLTLSDEKTRITHIKDGFNFLGFTFKKYLKRGIRNPTDISDYTLLITPERESLIRVLQKCQETIKKCRALPQTTLIKLLNPILRGWGNYYRPANSRLTFNKVDYAVWNKLIKWSIRRHNNKSKKWTIRNYFKQKGKSLYFETNDGLSLIRLSQTPTVRHIKVENGRRVYCKDDVKYWEKKAKREMYRKLYSKHYNLFKRQKGVCSECKTPLLPENELQVHHVIPKADSGTDKQSNLNLLHAECHRDLHRFN